MRIKGRKDLKESENEGYAEREGERKKAIKMNRESVLQ